MNMAKRKKLEQRGWKVGPASEFLGQTTEEARFIELKLASPAGGANRRVGPCPTKPTRKGTPKVPIPVKRPETGVI